MFWEMRIQTPIYFSIEVFHWRNDLQGGTLVTFFRVREQLKDKGGPLPLFCSSDH